MSGSGRDALPNVQEWLRVPHGCPGFVSRPSRMSRSCRDVLPDDLKWREALPDVRQGLGYPPG